MGWWPVKICVLLNLVVLIGYSMIDAVVAGQMLSAVSPDGSLTVEVGIIITAIITWVVTTFGIKIFHYYERLASPKKPISHLTTTDMLGYLKLPSYSSWLVVLDLNSMSIPLPQLQGPHLLAIA
jgi:purine-cytosine permease-like protein